MSAAPAAVWAPTFTVDAAGDDHRLLCRSCGVTWIRSTMAEVVGIVGRHTEEARCARGLCGGPISVLGFAPPVEFHTAGV